MIVCFQQYSKLVQKHNASDTCCLFFICLDSCMSDECEFDITTYVFYCDVY